MFSVRKLCNALFQRNCSIIRLIVSTQCRFYLHQRGSKKKVCSYKNAEVMWCSVNCGPYNEQQICVSEKARSQMCSKAEVKVCHKGRGV